jgi:hypothetical protein
MTVCQAAECACGFLCKRSVVVGGLLLSCWGCAGAWVVAVGRPALPHGLQRKLLKPLPHSGCPCGALVCYALFCVLCGSSALLARG